MADHRSGDFIAGLIGAVGAEHVLTDAVLIEPFVTDWTRRWRGAAQAVVRPATTEQVAAVMNICAAHGVAVVPQGGNTGLVGGSIPAEEPPFSHVLLPIVMSTKRLDQVSDVDQQAGQVTVGAGVTLGELHQHVQRAGWAYGVDLAARDSATIGGTVATNAGGIRVIAYGMTRMQIRGIEAVLPDGSIIEHLGGLIKDNTGYDLAGVLCGSEGTLGIITAVRVGLHRIPAETSVALIGVESFDEAIELLTGAVVPGAHLLAAEVTDETGIELAMQVTGLAWPLQDRHPLLLLLEVADGGTGVGFNESALVNRDVVMGLDSVDKQRLWEYRERQSEAFSAHAAQAGGDVAHKLDISLPIQQLAQCADQLRERMLNYSPVESFGIFGHLADGNLHVEIVGPSATDEEVDRLVLSVVSQYGGSVSAEHGIGRAKTAWLSTSRSAAEIRAMRALKDAWDPQGLMNPGVIFANEEHPSK